MENFDESHGFADEKTHAIKLFQKTVHLFDQWKINCFLISGTLLGQQRHDDIIPWDDDLDLLIDEEFCCHKDPFEMNEISFIPFNKNYKCFFSNYGKIFVSKEGYTYRWPNIDLFIYQKKSPNELIFFQKKWQDKYFFPLQKCNFLGISVSIPNDPTYFLSINYGTDYMDICKSSNWNHKEEKNGKPETIVKFDKLKQYYINKKK